MSDNQEPNDLRDVQPSSFSHVIGQSHVTQALKIAVEASFQENKRLDEILFCAPPGFGTELEKSAIFERLARATGGTAGDGRGESTVSARDLFAWS